MDGKTWRRCEKVLVTRPPQIRNKLDIKNLYISTGARIYHIFAPAPSTGYLFSDLLISIYFLQSLQCSLITLVRRQLPIILCLFYVWFEQNFIIHNCIVCRRTLRRAHNKLNIKYLPYHKDLKNLLYSVKQLQDYIV